MSEHWQRVKDLAGDALDLPAAEREAFLARSCSDDAALRAEVENLLTAMDDASGLLGEDTDTPSPMAAWFDEDTKAIQPLESGEQLGPFEIIAKLGEGGFSEVYRARQSEPVDREVAIKLLKPGMDSRAMLQRFEAERQTLARMSHPHIARVLDAGLLERRPYFVMDLVEGEPITTFATRHSLDLDAKLDLFAQVCDAVEHAHRRGVIHRDLKPSNVLVEDDAGTPRVRVIDFGISKMFETEDGPDAGPTLTSEGMFLGTPAYASPEQFGAGATDVDTRTDIYSLGVLLYELLTGSRPIDGDEATEGSSGTATPAVLRWFERLREQSPERPSVRVKKQFEGTETSATRTLVRILREDLDWIVLKALEFDRERRYPSPQALTEDLGRFTRNEPVLAGPPSRSYRARRFVRRNRVALIAAALILLSLVTGIVLAVRGTWKAQDAQREAEQAAQVAEDERKKAESLLYEANGVGNFLENPLEAARPMDRGADVRVVDLLDESRALLLDPETFAEVPNVEQRLQGVVGRTYMQLGAADRAEPHLLRQLDLATEIEGSESFSRAEALYDLVQLRNMQTREGEAAETLGQLRALIERTGSNEALDLDLQLLDGQRAFERGEFAEAIAVYRAARPAIEATDDPGELVTLLSNLSQSLQRTGEFDESLALARESLDVATESFGPTHTRTITAGRALGLALIRQDVDQAIDVLQATRLASNERYGPDHERTLGIETYLAFAYQSAKNFDAAAELYEPLLVKQERILGETNRQTLMTLHNLGMLQQGRGEIDRSIELLERALPRFTAARGPKHPETLACKIRLISVLADRDGHTQAEPAYQNALFEMRDVVGLDDPLFRQILGDWAEHQVDLAHERDAARDVEGVTRALGQSLEAWRALGDEPMQKRLLDFLIEAHTNFEQPEQAAQRRKERDALGK